MWLDDWVIQPGDDIYLAIERGLEASRIQVLCLSPAALGSEWVALERSTVLFRDPTNVGRRFIPLLLADCKLPDTLRRYKYVDFREEAETAFKQLLVMCREGVHLEPSPRPPLLESKIDNARSAVRKHDDENAICLWEDVRKRAEEVDDKPAEIRARLETALLKMRNGERLDDVLSVLDRCIQDASAIELGHDRPRLLQLLGEAHRLKGNFDRARGFITSALEHSRSLGQKLDEGWALLALSALEKEIGRQEASETELELIKKAYDCFSSVYVTGNQEKQRLAKEGFAACHSWRAAIFDHARLDDAMAEYARALAVFRELGEEHEWEVADVLSQRGDLQARADDPQLAGEDLFAAAELFKKLGDRIKEAECVMGIAELLDRVGRRLDSRSYYKAAAAITMQQKNQRRAAWIWFRYACKLVELREFEEANTIFSTLLQADWLSLGQRLDVLKNLCLVAKATEQQNELDRCSKEALEIIDMKIVEAKSADERRKLIISKGQMLEDLDDHDRAIACLRRAIEGFEGVSDQRGIGECWFHIAGIMRKTDRRKEEREAYEKALSFFGNKGDDFFVPMILTMLAQLEIFEERFDEARKHLEQAECQNEKLGNPVVFLVAQDLRSKLPPT